MDLLRTQGISPAKAAYLFCRYWALLSYPIILWAQVEVTDGALCGVLFRIPLIFSTINVRAYSRLCRSTTTHFLTQQQFSSSASVLIVRVYAFAGLRTSVAVILAVAFSAVAFFQAWVVFTQIELVPDAPACFPQDRHPGTHFLSWYFLAPFLFDVLATGIFVACAARIRHARASGGAAVSVFVREGLVYFLAISAVNLGNAAMSIQPHTAISGVLAPFSMCLPNVLACRLVINLRSTVSTTIPSQGGSTVTTGVGFTSPRPPRFARGDVLEMTAVSDSHPHAPVGPHPPVDAPGLRVRNWSSHGQIPGS